MSEIAASAKGLRLSPARIEQFHETGYLKNLPLLDQEGIATLQREFTELVDSVPDTVDIYRVNNWHKANRWFYELGRIPAVLDYVEDLLGPDPTTNRRFPGTRMPGTGPSNRGKPSPSGLRVFDADAENGCMRVVPGSHRWGDLEHVDLPGLNWTTGSAEEMRKSKYVLWKQVDLESFDPEDAVDIDLAPGEISLHDDDLIHGSAGNPSSRMRAGITLRYSPTRVKCDSGVWPTFEAYPARGTDRFGHNPVGKVPSGNGWPTQFNQSSSDFE